VALYNRALNAGEINSHYLARTPNNQPQASFTATPNPVETNTQVSFNGSASSDPDGTVTKYEWDLDGNGNYETDTGSTPTVTQAYADAGEYKVGLRVTDNGGATGTSSVNLTVKNQPPTASFSAVPSPRCPTRLPSARR
jgi:YD repeat-containing protein